MRVLITGASGKLGAYVIRQLADEYELVLMSRSRPAPEFAQIPWIEGDLSVWEDCRRAVVGIDAIQHIGAQPWPTDHPSMQERVKEANVPFD
ncbi:MAG: NAD-dependent epimerase/dehydratase family protein, partial [Caldilineaceae bacterium]|nr:NAD-dependent epimerase/dehydratase family protein [Caldilineaceae bacterium]